MIEFIQGNSRKLPFPDNYFHSAITSPPYYSKRDYGTAEWEGGNPGCDHKVGRFEYSVSEKQASNKGSAGHQARDICPKCGARRIDNQIGMEDSPEKYVSNMVQVFREIHRVLRDDGTLWLNLGDTNWGGKGKSAQAYATTHLNRKTLAKAKDQISGMGETRPADNRHLVLKPKDRIGIPWRVAFALQGFAVISIDQIAMLCKAIDSRDFNALDWFRAGFQLYEEMAGMKWFWNRADIIWAKPNGLPESVKDRPTINHEYIFQLTKSKKCYFDYVAIMEEANYDGRKDTKMKGSDKYKNGFVPGQPEQTLHARGHERWNWQDGVPMRRKRSVWTIPTAQNKFAHFATFPERLVEPCLLAGTSAHGCCPDCGAPWKRIVKSKSVTEHDGTTESAYEPGSAANRLALLRQAARERGEEYSEKVETLGWEPTCGCGQDTVVPCRVLDPFCGSGTVGVVCARHGRDFIGIDLNPEYIEIARKRLNGTQRKLIP